MPYNNEVLHFKPAKIHILAGSNGNVGEVETVIKYSMNGWHDGNEMKNIPEDRLSFTKKAAARRVIVNMGYYVDAKDLKDHSDE